MNCNELSGNKLKVQHMQYSIYCFQTISVLVDNVYSTACAVFVWYE